MVICVSLWCFTDGVDQHWFLRLFHQGVCGYMCFTDEVDQHWFLCLFHQSVCNYMCFTVMFN